MAAEPTSVPEFSLPATDAEPVLLASAATIHSRILEEDRTFLMRVPPRAQKSAEVPLDLTVIYILDAEKHFASAAASAAFFEASRISSLGPVAVVGIVSTDRTRDFTPTASNARRDGTIDEKAPVLGGGADKFLEFLTTELRDAAEKRLPAGTRVVRRMLIGHSYGGLFTLHALLTHPERFDVYAALDPSLWWTRGRSKSSPVSMAQQAFNLLQILRCFTRPLPQSRERKIPSTFPKGSALRKKPQSRSKKKASARRSASSPKKCTARLRRLPSLMRSRSFSRQRTFRSLHRGDAPNNGDD
ncbi:MAG: alpha/beta hydrolase-fold protein [Sutterella seckii]